LALVDGVVAFGNRKWCKDKIKRFKMDVHCSLHIFAIILLLFISSGSILFHAVQFLITCWSD